MKACNKDCKNRGNALINVVVQNMCTVVYLNTRTLLLTMYMSPTIICIPVDRDELRTSPFVMTQLMARSNEISPSSSPD